MQFEAHKQNNTRRIRITMSIILRRATMKCAIYESSILVVEAVALAQSEVRPALSK